MKTTRTTIALRNDLIKDIMRFEEAKTKSEAVEEALSFHVNWLKRQKLRSFRGKIQRQGDIKNKRRG